MNRSNQKTKLALLAVLMISIFGIIPMVSGKTQIHGWPGYMFKEHRIAITDYGWFFPFQPATTYIPDLANTPSYFSAHMDYHEDWADSWPANPYKIKLFIDNEEIGLKRFHYYAKEEPYYMFAPDSHNWIFTQSFEVGFFEAGEEYDVRVEFWVQKPFGDDDRNEWRIFNLGGEWIFTYTLCIYDPPPA